ncbi:archease [Thermosipho ferrireducens]|uniref:Archease n=1 Tax=Thermosipho ferrireducens TaxID=2571116 RepID=A0ABX7S8E2_9BACT|nr:archease [Thermosipho ferrireducens]QTA38869.1 archease [Thermosipho ferrireducens]
MYKEIEHTADVAFEIMNESFLGVLKDILDIIVDFYKPEYLNCSYYKRQIYEISEDEDGIFDIVNDWIAAIDLGYFPKEVDFENGNYVTLFCSYTGLLGEKFKALTYHSLRLEKDQSMYRTKVVFDV